MVCNSLVRSSRQFISVGPSMISTIMQNMTSAAAAAAEEKAKAADSDNVEGLFNFAPHGKKLSLVLIFWVKIMCRAVELET